LLGYNASDIVCIYTGRFTQEKNPLIFAEAIEELGKMGYPYRGLFVGDGEQKQAIQNFQYSRVIDFMPFKELPAIYQSGDIGVWPSQESTSQLDAVASGLNLVLTSNIQGYATIESENSEKRPRIVSRSYKHFDKEDLKKQLLSLENKTTRAQLSQLGLKEIEEKYSWLKIAKKRILDYSNTHTADVSASMAIFILLI
jgi:glycosyltransferase involved in cell wall biosynthesis